MSSPCKPKILLRESKAPSLLRVIRQESVYAPLSLRSGLKSKSCEGLGAKPEHERAREIGERLGEMDKRAIETIDEDGWLHRRCDGEVGENSKFIGGVLCRWWGLEEPEGVKTLNDSNARQAAMQGLADALGEQKQFLVGLGLTLTVGAVDQRNLADLFQPYAKQKESLRAMASKAEAALSEAKPFLKP